MGFTDQSVPVATGTATTPLLLPDDAELPVEPATPPPSGPRVNWLFSGVMLGAAGWMLVLAVIFAATDNWVVAGVLLGAVVLCVLAVWRAGRRVARAQRPGRHRANGSSAS
jgi:hypothetical protein